MKTPPRFPVLCLVLAISLLVPGARLSIFALAQNADSTPVVAESSLGHEPPGIGVDTTPPVIAPAPDLIGAAVDANGAVVTWSLPVANDEADGVVPAMCDRASGAVFPLGTTAVNCSARDKAGNIASMPFLVTILDQTAPVVSAAPDISVDALDAGGAVAFFTPPGAFDNVDGVVGVWCDRESGSFFPVGVSVVTCSAVDAAGNMSGPVSFSVLVNPPQEPVVPEPSVTPESVETPVTLEPSAVTVETEVPLPAELPTGESETETPVLTPDGAATPAPSATPEPTQTPLATSPALPTTPTTTPEPTSEPVVPPMLELPWPLPGSFAIDVYGGPLNGLQAIWGNGEYPITQEFGHTAFSIAHVAWYAYGTSYGLDGFEHPGIDIGMPAGTWLYSPVNGPVIISGNSPYYTYYGNGQSNVGELLILTDDGNEVVLGHMGRIAVNVGDYVTVGQFVGLSGGDNGDHLHLEARALQPGGWLLAVDPRASFLIDSLAAARPATDEAAVMPPLPLSTDNVASPNPATSGPRMP